MCGHNEHHHHEEKDCLCKKICAVVKLLLAGAVLGTIAGMVGMYFFDHDKYMQHRARKMLKGAEDFTHNIQSKIEGSSSN